MQKVYWLPMLSALILNSSCDGSINSSASFNNSDMNADFDEEVVAIETAVLHKDIENFVSSILDQKLISKRQMKAALLVLDQPDSGRFEVESQNQLPVTQGADLSTKDQYFAVEIGSLVYIYQYFPESFHQGFKIYDSVPKTYLQSQPLATRAKSFVETKYYDRARIKRIQTTLSTLEFMARMFPGVDGVDRLIRGETKEAKVLGTVMAAGDIAFFGIGSKITIARNIAKGTVASSAVIRIAASARNVKQHGFNTTNSANLALAFTEAGLVSVSFVKIKINRATLVGYVNSRSDAKMVSKIIQKEEDEILSAGLTLEDLRKLNLEKYAQSIAKSKAAYVFRTHDINFLENAVRTGNYSSARFRDFFNKIHQIRGYPVSADEMPLAVMYEIMIQKSVLFTKKPYKEIFAELTNFNVFFSGLNTAKTFRIPVAGSSRPDAIHRIIDKLLKNANINRSVSKPYLISELKRLGYVNPEKYDLVLNKILYFYRNILPLAPKQSTRLYTVQNLSNSTDSISDALAKYFSKGNISTGLNLESTLSFIPNDAKRAMVIELLPSPTANMLPITGGGKLSELSDALQKSRNYSGAVKNEVIVIPRSGGQYRIVSQSTSRLGRTELTNLKIILE